jgi:hypothetical protein
MIGLLKLNLHNLNRLTPDLRGITTARRRTGSTLLGLALDGQRIEAVLARRSNGAGPLRVLNSAAGSLELNLLTDAPELVGREIRNFLDRAGIRERSCAVCLPLDWVLTAQTALPDLSPEDTESFINLEAERGLPFGLDTLAIARSMGQTKDGARYATIIAIPRENLAILQRSLKAAGLRPISFSLGLPALQKPELSLATGAVALRLGESSVELQVTSGGGIASLRALQGAVEQDGVRKRPYADVVARDLRITLGQLSAELRKNIQALKIFGNGDGAKHFVEDLSSRARLMDLNVEWVRSYRAEDFGIEMAKDIPVSPALSLAARTLLGQSSGLEFLPPKVSAWKQVATRYSSGKLAWTGVAAGVVALLVAGAFIVQEWQLSTWEKRWSAIQPEVRELDHQQQLIRRFRPWFDESFRSLSVLQKLTETFPEDGAVTAKSIEIREPGSVTCSGAARDNQALLDVTNKLRASSEISGVQVTQMRGSSPIQFKFNLLWRQGQGGGQ